MKANASSVVFMMIGTTITLLLVAGVFFLISLVIPLSSFFLWLGLASSSCWTLISFAIAVEVMTNSDSKINAEAILISCGLSAVSMCAFGYFGFS